MTFFIGYIYRIKGVEVVADVGSLNIVTTI